MRSFLRFVVLSVAVVQAKPVPFYQAPANIDTPDDQDVINAAAGAIPQGGGSSFFYPAGGDTSSSSSSSSEEVGSEIPDEGGSVPFGTASPVGGNPVGSNPVGSNPVGQGPPSGTGTGGQQGQQGAGQGKQGISDQNSGEQQAGAGALLVAGDPSALSKIQAHLKSNNVDSSAGQSAGIAIGVLALITMATGAIIFAIRKRRNGFMRFYSQANAEL